MLSVSNLMILWLEVDSVEGFADFGSAGANPAEHSMEFWETRSDYIPHFLASE